MTEEKKQPEQEMPEEKAKTPWELQKESWYDKIPLNLKQMDMIVALCWILLALTVVAMYLDTKGIVNIF